MKSSRNILEKDLKNRFHSKNVLNRFLKSKIFMRTNMNHGLLIIEEKLFFEKCINKKLANLP